MHNEIMAEARQEEVKRAIKAALDYYRAVVGRAQISKVKLENQLCPLRSSIHHITQIEKMLIYLVFLF